MFSNYGIESAGSLGKDSDCIRVVHSSNQSRDTDYPERGFRGSTQSLQVNSGIVPLIRPRPFFSSSLPINYLLIIQSFNASIYY
jgi:hypothetical protein